MEEQDHELVRKLIALKRYESPTPDYFERFLDEFHERQRQALLHQSSWQLFLDRFHAYTRGMIRPLAFAGAGLCAVTLAGVMTVTALKSDRTDSQEMQWASEGSSGAIQDVSLVQSEDFSNAFHGLPSQELVMMPRPEFRDPTWVENVQESSQTSMEVPFEPYISPVDTINGGLLPASFRLDVKP